MTTSFLFDMQTGEALKHEGMELACSNRPTELEIARQIAVDIAKRGDGLGGHPKFKRSDLDDYIESMRYREQ